MPHLLLAKKGKQRRLGISNLIKKLKQEQDSIKKNERRFSSEVMKSLGLQDFKSGKNHGTPRPEKNGTEPKEIGR